MRTIGANLKTHVALPATTIATYFRLTLTQQQPDVTAITQANPGAVTTEYAHGLTTGATVQLKNVGGMTQVEGNFYTATVTSTTAFTIGTNTAAFTPYTSGGEVRKTYGLSNIDVDFTLDGVTYVADVGYIPTAMRSSQDMGVDNFETQGVYSPSINISEDDIHAGRLDYAEFESGIVNYESLGDGKMIIAFGHMGELRTERNGYFADFQSLSSILAQDTIKLTSPDCPYDLGDADCKVALAASPSFTTTGTVTATSANDKFTDTARTEATRYFNHGLVTWTSGANVGLQMEVRDFTSDEFELFEKMPFDIQVGDAYKAVAGCDKLHATCISKFNNVINFGGFNDLPGTAQISQVGLQRG